MEVVTESIFNFIFPIFKTLQYTYIFFIFFPAKSGLLFFHIQKIGSPNPDFFPAWFQRES